MQSSAPSESQNPLANDEVDHSVPTELKGLTKTPENLHYEVIEKIKNYFQDKETTASEG
ncbi:hypothetical protein [uncultured Psychrobacter sp.]|uniref:hypothetical protein n=1 Tax=uncultured Psychrobacter sp. TaxID=259303 RepID=UPI0030D93512